LMNDDSVDGIKSNRTPSESESVIVSKEDA
jgi:hypothetical protein